MKKMLATLLTGAMIVSAGSVMEKKAQEEKDTIKKAAPVLLSFALLALLPPLHLPKHLSSYLHLLILLTMS